MSLIMLVGITGNASIIIIILRNKLLRLQPTNLFLLNMAVSDLLNLCICPILYIFRRDILFVNYYLPKFCCIATPFLTGTLKYNYRVHAIIITQILFFFLFHSHHIPLGSTKPYSHNYEQGHWNSNTKTRQHVGVKSIYCLCYFSFDMDYFIWNSCANLQLQTI